MDIGYRYVVRASCSGTSLYTVTERLESHFHIDHTERDKNSL